MATDVLRGPIARQIWTIVGILLAAALVVAGLFAFVWALSGANVSKDMSLPILMIAAVVLVLVVLAVVAVGFSMLDLTDKTQALALPEGSVRAVIAVTLIVLFGILSIYLYSSMATLELQKITGLSEVQKNQLVNTAPVGPPPIVVVDPRSADAVAGTAETFTVYVRNNRDPASDDFAKQVLVLLGTLVTSISSFYFGTKAAATGMSTAAALLAAAPDPPAPTVTAIAPNVRARDGVPIPFSISGTNLADVTAVKLVSGRNEVAAKDVDATASTVKCTISVNNTQPAGAWDVVVTTSAGKVARLAGGVTLSP